MRESGEGSLECSALFRSTPGPLHSKMRPWTRFSGTVAEQERLNVSPAETDSLDLTIITPGIGGSVEGDEQSYSVN